MTFISNHRRNKRSAIIAKHDDDETFIANMSNSIRGNDLFVPTLHPHVPSPHNNAGWSVPLINSRSSRSCCDHWQCANPTLFIGTTNLPLTLTYEFPKDESVKSHAPSGRAKSIGSYQFYNATPEQAKRNLTMTGNHGKSVKVSIVSPRKHHSLPGWWTTIHSPVNASSLIMTEWYLLSLTQRLV